MSRWIKDSERVLSSREGSFTVFVDMRGLNPLSKDSDRIMRMGQKMYSWHGMERSVVILDSVFVTIQFKNIAEETGIYRWERYIDASKETEWEQKGLDWILRGIDPDK